MPLKNATEILENPGGGGCPTHISRTVALRKIPRCIIAGRRYALFDLPEVEALARVYLSHFSVEG